jgi:hypothetical protein
MNIMTAKKKSTVKKTKTKKTYAKGAKKEMVDALTRKLAKDIWDDDDYMPTDHTLIQEDYDVDAADPYVYDSDKGCPDLSYFGDEFEWKYGEEELLDQLKEYIKSTYGQHYANVKTGTQVLDMYESIGIAIPSCQANAIKYLCRYGKKNGEERKDLFKALHYTILLIHFIELQNRESEVY